MVSFSSLVSKYWAIRSFLRRRTQSHRNKDIVLAICPAWDRDMPPLGLAYLSRFLRAHTFQPLVLDLNIEIFHSVSQQMRKYWSSANLFYWTDIEFFDKKIKQAISGYLDSWARYIISTGIQVVGLSINRANIYTTIELMQKLRNNDFVGTIIVGGHGCSIEGERIRIPKGLVDIFVQGEGEQALVDILTDLKSSDNRKQKKTTDTILKAPPIADIDSIPFPDFSEFTLEKYRQKRLPIIGSRGCVNRCYFCNDWIVWPRYRSRRGELVFEEVKHHYNRYDIRIFEFVDLAVSSSAEEFEIFCDHVIQEGLKIKWIANFCVTRDPDKNVFEKFRQAGCRALRMGIESGSDRILAKYNKKFVISQAEEALAMIHAAAIETHINLIVGFPGESEEDYQDTLNFVERNRSTITRVANVHPFYITPSSIVEKNHQKFGVVFPNHHDFSLTWYDEKGNTYELRKKRARQLKEHVKNLQLDFQDDKALVFYDEA